MMKTFFSEIPAMTRETLSRSRPAVRSALSLLLPALMLLGVPAMAATTASVAACTVAAPCLWSNAASWTAGVPNGTDTVIITANTGVILNVNSNNITDLTIQNGAILRGDGTGWTLTLGRGGGEDLTNNGTLDFSAPNNATVVLNKNGQWGGTGTWNLSQLNLNTKNLTFTNPTTAVLNFSGNASPIINPGRVTSLATITWNFAGTVAQMLPATNNVVYGPIRINNTAGTTLGIDLTAANLLGGVNVQSGILNNGGFAITLPAGQSFQVQNGATFNLTGTTTMAGVSGGGAKTFGATSTVDYGGANQAVTTETYGHLILSGSGTKTPAAGAAIVAGNFTLSGGVTYTGTTNNPAYEFRGNFSNSGTFNSGTGVYTFNGSAAQTLTGATTFTNLTLNNATGLTINNDLTVTTAAAGTLTFTSGVITTGANKVVVARACNNAGTITRTSGHVAGNIQLSFPTGSNISCTFHTGDTTTYRPINVTFASITSAGSAIGTSSQSAGDHPNIATADIDATRSVNRYWTLTNAGIAFTNYSATFNFVAGDLDAGVNTSAVVVRRFSGGSWDLTTVTGTLTGTSSQATTLTGFGDFAIGQTTVNHYFVSNAATGVNCAAENVTIAAHNSAHSAAVAAGRTITVTAARVAGAAGNHGDWSLVTGTGILNNGTADDGVATYAFAAGESSVVLALKDTHVQTVNIAVTDGTATDTSGTASADAGYNQDLGFVNSGFRVTDGGGPPVPATIATQTAGTASATYGLQAIRTDTNTGACVGAFASGSDVTVELASQCNNPIACIAGQNVTITNNAVSATIASNPNAAVTAYTSRSLRFGANSQALFTLNYPDVGLISLFARYNIPLGTGAPSGNYMSGSSNQFVVKPAGFTLSSIQQTAVPNLANPGAADAAGAKFIKAGEAFSVTVTARNSAGSPTPNYGQEITPETVRLASSLVAGLGLTNNPALANPTAFGAFGAGVATGTTFSWGEVGIMKLTPSVSDADYLGAGDVTGTTSGNVGRFIPDHFDASLNAPQFATACASGSFTYIGQPFVYATAPVITVTARNLAGVTTQNYKGTSPAAQAWWKITNTSLTSKTYTSNAGTPDQAGVPSTDPVIAVTGNGIGTLTFDSGSGLILPRSTEVVPFDAEISLAINVIDTDGVIYASNPARFGQTTTGNGIAFSTAKQMRFGRLTLGNAFGSELLDLPIPMETQYYNSSGVYVTNVADSCTTIALNNVFLSSGTATIGGAFVSGKGTLKINKPLSKVSIDLCVDLDGASPTDPACVAPTPGNKSWLQWKWSGSTYDRDPKARATFGVFKNADEFIYLRENF